MIATAYIDTDDYCGRYGGVYSEELADILEKASEEIDILTGCAISSIGFDTLDECTKEHIRIAAAKEAEYLLENGGSASAAGMPVQMTLGRFSYRTAYSSGAEKRWNSVPEAVKAHLEAAGLLYRGLAV